MTEIMQSSFHLIPARRAFLTRSGGAVLSATAIALLVGHRGNAAEQQREIKALIATVKEQAAQIQRVSAHLELSKAAPQTVLNNQ